MAKIQIQEGEIWKAIQIPLNLDQEAARDKVEKENQPKEKKNIS